MKTCKNCGTKNFDTNSRCDKCFYPFLSPAEELRAKAPSNLALAARIFLIINIM